MKILVSGTRGFLGGRLAGFFKENNVTVISLNRKKNFKLTKKYETTIEKKCRGVDVIVNCIGTDIHTSKNKKQTIFTNSDIPNLIYKAGNKAGVKYFFFISTYHVYDFNQKKINEISDLKKKNLYTKSKILGEKKIKNSKGKTKIIILRLCNLFGYPAYKNKNPDNLLINYIIKNSIKKKPIKIKSKYNEVRYYSSIKTFNKYLFKIIKNLDKINFRKKTKIYNYYTDRFFKITDLIKYLNNKKIFNNKIKIKYKFKKLLDKKKFKFLSLNTKFLPKKDDYFLDEISKTIEYYKNKR